MYNWSIIFCLKTIFIISCAALPVRHDSLLGYQPMVISINPSDGETVSPDVNIKVSFSQEIDPSSINSKTFAIVKITDGSVEVNKLAADIAKANIDVVDGKYEMFNDNTSALFTPAKFLEKGQMYGVLLNSGVMSVDRLPLNQAPGETAVPFFSIFYVSQDDNIVFDNESPSHSSNQDSQGSVNRESDNKKRPSWLVINELLYDAVGNETDGNLFIELAGEPGADISGYSVVFINGADGRITETVHIPEGSKIPDDGIFLIADSRTNAKGETNIPGADMLDNFDPQNGPDCAQLFDDHNALFDVVGYGEPLPLTAQNNFLCYEGTPAPDASAGKSISRIDSTDTNNNAADFIILDPPTPGFR